MRQNKTYLPDIYTPAMATATFVILLLMSGCKDDTFDSYKNHSGDDIHLRVSVDNIGDATRSGTPRGNNLKFGAPIPMANEATGDTLYLLPEIADREEIAVPAYADPMTRGTVVGATTSQAGGVTKFDDMYDEIGVSAYNFEGSWKDYADAKWAGAVSTWTPNYFIDYTAKKTADPDNENGNKYEYAFSPRRFWPGEGKLRFIAHAPLNDWHYQFSPNLWGWAGPGMAITVPESVEDQKDALIAITSIDGYEKNSTVELRFKHILTCVRFVCSPQMQKCTIKSVKLKNVIPDGGFFFFRDDNKISDLETIQKFYYNPSISKGLHYSLGSDRKTFTLTFPETGLDVGANSPVGTYKDWFIMLPQFLDDAANVEAEIELEQEVAGRVQQFRIWGKIKGHNWEPGKIVTYRVSFTDWFQDLDVYPQPTPFSPQGGEHDLLLTSFKTNWDNSLNPERVPAPWTVEFKEITIDKDGNESEGVYQATPPDWLQLTDAAGNIITGGEGCTYDNPYPMKLKIAEAKPIRERDIDQTQGTSGTVGTATNPVHLAAQNRTGTEIWETANSYIVDRSGYYVLPLVYGNGIYKGADNKQAYSPDVSGTHVLGNFINHLGNQITSPFILDNPEIALGSNPAYIIWQDAGSTALTEDVASHKNGINSPKGPLVTDVAYVPDAYTFNGKSVPGIRFNVNYRQGNATIGIKDNNGKTIWSWHIWATSLQSGIDEGIPSSIKIVNHNNREFEVMNVNLGWVSYDPVKVYGSVKCKLLFKSRLGESEEYLWKEITVVRLPYFKYWHGYNPYYQWGRKDPFQPVERDFTNYPWYEGNATSPTTNYMEWQNLSEKDLLNDTGAGIESSYNKPDGFIGAYDDNPTVRIKNRILYPNTFDKVVDYGFNVKSTDTNHPEFHEGYDKTYYNLWNASVTDPYNGWDFNDPLVPLPDPSKGVSVKTIYDPCPPGWKIPPLTAFMGFTETGHNLNLKNYPKKNWNGRIETYSYLCRTLGERIETASIFLFYAYASHKNSQGEYNYLLAMPSMGYRDWRNYEGNLGRAYQMGTDAFYWTSGAYDLNRGYYLTMMRKGDEMKANDHVRPLDYFWHVDAMPIRPVRIE